MSRTYRVPDYYGKYSIYKNRKRRDGKPRYKAPKWFKMMCKRMYKTRAKQLIREGKEPEVEKKTINWKWN